VSLVLAWSVLGNLMQRDNEQVPEDERSKARRAFLAKCGRFAAVTGPAVALMLTAGNNAEAPQAASNQETK
jgi:hypothetical protein